MENALIYRRVSTDEQAGDERHSLDTQLSICSKSIDNSGKYQLAPDGVYGDPGRTGTNMNRPGLQDMLLRVQEDRSIKAIFVQDTDRLARNALDHMQIKAILKKHKVEIVSVSQPGISDSPEGNFMDLVIAGVNQLQSQITARKTLKSLEEKFDKGEWPTHAPIGYLNVPDKENPDKRTVAIDKERGYLITEAFKMYSTGNYSILELRDILYKKGFRTRSGGILAHSKMNELLKNHFYYGEMRWKDMVGPGRHVPLTDKTTFDICQKIMNEHNRYRCHRRKFRFLLNGFVWCANCGYRYTAENHFNKNKSYYHCNRHGNRKEPDIKKKCMDRYVEVEELESQVQKRFNKLQFSEEFISKIESRLKIAYDNKKKSVIINRDRITQTKIAIEKKLEIAEEKLIAGTLDDAGFTRLKSRYREQIGGFDQELSKLNRTKNMKVDTIQQVLSLTRNIGSSYHDADFELKRLYIGLFWERFEARDRKIQEAIKSPIVRALEAVGSIDEKELEKETPNDGGEVIIPTFRGDTWELNP